MVSPQNWRAAWLGAFAVVLFVPSALALTGPAETGCVLGLMLYLLALKVAE